MRQGGQNFINKITINYCKKKYKWLLNESIILSLAITD